VPFYGEFLAESVQAAAGETLFFLRWPKDVKSIEKPPDLKGL